MNFNDAMPVTGQITRTDDGAVVIARVARGSNVQEYLGSEMGMADRAVVRVYRPDDQVFSRDAINSYARKPITIDHPKDGVTPDSWKDFAVGEIDPVGILRDGEFVTVPLVFRDAAAIKLIESADGPKELSMGYSAEIEMIDGVSPSGEPYDAIMSDFKMNHVAVVREARGGNQLRVSDGAPVRWGASPYNDRKDAIMAEAIQTRTVLIDGLSVITTDAGAQALEKLMKQIADMSAGMTAAEKKYKEEADAKDAELAEKDAKIAASDKAVLTDDEIDVRVEARAELIGQAKSIAKDIATAGMSDAAIRKAAVVAVLGDAALTGKSDAYVDAMFDVQVASAAIPIDAFADGVKGGLKVVSNDAWASFLPSKGA